MYRQHLKMVHTQDLEMNKPRSEFLQCVTSIPVVYLAWNIAAETYSNIKGSNKVLKISLNSTEKVAGFITKPVIQRFEKQLKSADLIACRSFQALQGFVPYLLFQQQKLVKQTLNLYEDTVESGLKKYETIKKMGTNKCLQLLNEGSEKLEEFRASPYGEVCEIALDFTLEAGEMYVDHYLPPLGDERPEKLFGDRGKEPAWKRTELLRHRVKERFYKHTLLKIQMIRLKIRNLLISVYHTNPYEYLVNVSASLPGITVTIVSLAFSTFQDALSYLTIFLKINENQSDLV